MLTAKDSMLPSTFVNVQSTRRVEPLDGWSFKKNSKQYVNDIVGFFIQFLNFVFIRLVVLKPLSQGTEFTWITNAIHISNDI